MNAEACLLQNMEVGLQPHPSDSCVDGFAGFGKRSRTLLHQPHNRLLLVHIIGKSDRVSQEQYSRASFVTQFPVAIPKRVRFDDDLTLTLMMVGNDRYRICPI